MIIKLCCGILLSSFFIFLGIRIWKKEKVTFFAGVSENMLKNEKKLAERIGKLIILFGIETVLLIFTSLFIINFQSYYYGILAMLHVLVILLFLVIDQLEY